MRVYYFDANVQVKYYLPEPSSAWVRQIVDEVDAEGKIVNALFTVEISMVEVAAAIAVIHIPFFWFIALESPRTPGPLQQVVSPLLIKQFSYRNPLMYAPDDLAQKGGYREDSDVGQHLFRGDRDGISGHNLFDGEVSQTLSGWGRESGMGEGEVDIFAPLLLDDVHGLVYGTGRVYLVINDEDVLLSHVADESDSLAIYSSPSLLDEGHRQLQFLGKIPAFFGKAQIGSDDDRVGQVFL